MGGAKQVYTSLEVRRRFSYANVRKASYRGSKTLLNKIITSLNYNCDKVESKEGGLRRDEVENKDLRER